MNNKVNETISEIKKVIKGKDEIIKTIIAVILSNGHVLLDDIPGVGKTTLALTFSKVLSLKYKRIQFTPDVMPSDITGFHMYDKKTESFVYRDGSAVCNLLLADEINRTSPKTQSALLEVMEEGKITVDGVTKVLSKPFIVIATQNPLGSFGTQRLPQSQLDRFMVKLSMGYPDQASEIEILKNDSRVIIDKITALLSAEEVVALQNEVTNITVSEKIYAYIANIAYETRNNENLSLGISPRGSRALLKMARATAYLNNRDYVIPEDISDVLIPVVAHRIELSSKAKAKGLNENNALSELLLNVSVPRI